MQYKLSSTSDGIIKTDNEGIIWYVPNEPLNKDWQEYQAWLAESEENQPEPSDD